MTGLNVVAILESDSFIQTSHNWINLGTTTCLIRLDLDQVQCLIRVYEGYPDNTRTHNLESLQLTTYKEA